jgi:hypothetical protein
MAGARMASNYGCFCSAVLPVGNGVTVDIPFGEVLCSLVMSLGSRWRASLIKAVGMDMVKWRSTWDFRGHRGGGCLCFLYGDSVARAPKTTAIMGVGAGSA